MSKGADFNARALAERGSRQSRTGCPELPEVTRHRDMASLSYGYSTVCFWLWPHPGSPGGEGERGGMSDLHLLR